jgi:hypothetical protein
LDPGDLPDIIPDLISTILDKLEIEVDAGGLSMISNAGITPDLPEDGPVSVDYETTVTGLAPGDHDICVTATGSDPGGSDSVTQCETIHLLQLALSPAFESNELGSDNDHTVTATILGDPAQVAGRLIDFAVSGQNGGAAGTCAPLDCMTDAAGQVTFAYSTPVEPDSLGEDWIKATTVIAGEDTFVEVHKEWVDTTPPEALCYPTANPHGDQEPVAPGKGGQGQNQDGFYEMSGSDDVWPPDTLGLFVTDTESGTVFGPFAVGTRIKYVEANGATPSISPMGGNNGKGGGLAIDVDWKIVGNGDAAVTAVDGSGNVGGPVFCLVPPPPK